MKLSLFSPTHRIKHLLETYYSLKLQGHSDFEWVLVPNGGVTPEDIPEVIRSDNRVVIRPYEHKNIGALKRYACEQASGDVFIEMDHDDILVPGALARIDKAYQSGAGFVYSDNAGFQEKELAPRTYDSRWGWEAYPVRIYNRTLLATRMFDIGPRSLCSIGFAPDHVRSWSRDAYFKAGGHDSKLLVADDHDLICRTYLSGAEFEHTGGCDYLYRFHSENTVLKYGGDIQRLQTDNQNKYMWPLIDEWARREKYPFVELTDQARLPLPWPDNSVGCIKAWDVLQLLPIDRAIELINDIYRVLLPGGWLCLKCPHTSSRIAALPANKSFWNEEVVDCFCRAETAKKQLPSYRGRFQSVRCWTTCHTEADKARNLPSVFADLYALKGQRSPGRNYI